MKNIVLISLLTIITFCTFAQNDNPLVRKGNNNYEKGNYTEAEKFYRKAIEANKQSSKGIYNLGNSLYKQNRFAEASKIYDTLLNNSSIDESLKAKIYHNIGNSLLNEAINNKTIQSEQKQELAKKSIEAYKKSLRINPKDNDTKYNLSYAQKLVQQIQQQQQQNQNKDNKNNKDNKDQNKNQNKDNKDKDKKDDNKNQENKNDQNKDKKEEEKKAGDSKMSKDDAERMLNAVQNKEKQTLENVDKAEKAVKVKILKDW